MQKNIDVLGIGNAIVDILANIDDQFLEDQQLPKGSMQLIDDKQAANIYASLPPATEKSGGSAANTLAGIASFGANAAFIGTVANDDLGQIFTHDMKSIGVSYDANTVSMGLKTARSMVCITPDAERTMATYLGVAPKISEDDIDESLIARAKLLYFEGYLWDEPETKKAITKAMELGKRYDCTISFSLSDRFCVDRHREEFLHLLKEYVDIVFCNEDEANHLLENTSVETSMNQLLEICDIVNITRGRDGTLVSDGTQRISLPAKSDINVVDTTGAGDLYAAGFLYGLTQDMPLKQCAHYAIEAASEVITHIGARPEVELKGLLASV